MSTKHWKGAALPDAGDDLLASWRDYTDTAGLVVPAQSIASARSTLTRAVDNGANVTVNNPAYFDVGGVLYRADGSKGAGGAWVLKPANEVEYDVQRYGNGQSGGWTGTVKSGASSGMCATKLIARPYDRMMMATAVAWGLVKSGSVDLALTGQNGELSLGRFSSGTQDCVTVTMLTFVRAGEQPSVSLAVRGGSPSGGTLTLSGDTKLNYFSVLAFPVSMAD